MIGPVEKKSTIRIAGYLQKRGKMKLVMCRWKRWWFVLEGRLLLYYKSQLEYLNLSPCRGSLNMGLASSVRPSKSLELTVITRSQTVTLRASNRVDHEQWLQSLLDAMALPHASSTFSTRPVMHFRYASQEHHENIIERIKSFRGPTYTAISTETGTPTQSSSCETSTASSNSSDMVQSRSEKCLLRRVLSDSRTLLQRPYKRSSVRSSVRLSKIAFSDTAIPVSSPATCLTQAHSSDKCQSMQELRNSPCTSEENEHIEEQKCENHLMKNSVDIERSAVNGNKENNLSNSIKIELNLEDLQSKNGNAIKEQKIGNVKIVLDGCAIYGSTTELKHEVGDNSPTANGKTNHDDYGNKKKLTLKLYNNNNKEVKSDTDLSIRRKTRGQSLSCENMQTLDRSIGSTYLDASAKVELFGREHRVPNLIAPESAEGSSGRKPNKKRSNSILSRFMESKTETGSDTLERRGTIKKRLSFLRKVWKKREKKQEEEDYESVDYDSIPVVIELPSPELEKAEDLLLSLERQGDLCPEPEPPPDYDTSITEELEVPPLLPPRSKQRPVSPWHDVPKNNKPVLPPEEDHPPPLPLKTKERNQVSIKITQDSSSIEHTHTSVGGDSVLCQPPSSNGEQKLEDLDTLLAQLTEVNTYVVRQIDISQSLNGNVLQVSAAPEPDYDVPRPHISLLATLRTQHIRSDTFPPTHFLCTTPLVDMDSLDPVINRLDAEMTPDSLECDSPLSLSQASWSRPTLNSDSSQSDSLLRHFITTEDKLFPDSLNT